MSDNEFDETSIEGVGVDDGGSEEASNLDSRRSALKKAAVAGGLAAGAWAAPRIEGLSLVPDYAAAGTARGTFTFKRTSTDLSAYYTTTDDCWGNNNCTPVTQAATIGGEPISITWAGRADIGGSGTATVDFTMMDPPFNSNCRVTGAEGNVTCCFGDHRTNSVNPTQVIWSTGPNGVQTAQGVDVTITVVC